MPDLARFPFAGQSAGYPAGRCCRPSPEPIGAAGNFSELVGCTRRPPRNKIMTKSTPSTLTVVAIGSRCSIDVPTARAAALSAYLREHGISSDPPEPSSSGLENIVLHRGANVTNVQALLDAWK